MFNRFRKPFAHNLYVAFCCRNFYCINKNINIVFFIFRKNDLLAKFFYHAVNAYLGVSLSQEIIEKLVILPFSSANNRRENFHGCTFFGFTDFPTLWSEPRPLGVGVVFLRLGYLFKNDIKYLLVRKFLNLFSTDKAVGLPNTCKQDTHVVVNFRNSSNGRSWIR